MTVRAKFKCDTKTTMSLTMSPVFADGNPENKEFFNATPSGQIMMSVLNQSAIDAFEVGKSYYVDFTPAE